MENAGLTVLVPVYSGVAQVRRCLDSVLRAQQRVSCRLLLIFDCGPERDTVRLLEKYARYPRVELLYNQRNLGFARSVNRGIRHSQPDDVVVLNSDTIVSSGWLDRLVAVADSDPRTGTVTPLSSNGEICSFPHICRENPILNHYSAHFVDAVLAKVNPANGIAAPTGVGFCMLMRRAMLDRIGIFDEGAFGLGYGEETDLCQRARAAGFRNLIAPNGWVYHVGGTSFGGRKSALLARHNRIVHRRYPHYFAAVERFIAQDPLEALRLRGVLGIMRESRRPAVLFLSHGMGGGTARHIAELCDHLDSQCHCLRLEPMGKGLLGLHLPPWLRAEPLLFRCPAQQDRLLKLLSVLAIGMVHIHHVMGLERQVEPILDAVAAPHRVTLHDYYLLDGNPTLTDPQGRFDTALAAGVPERELQGRTGLERPQWHRLCRRVLLGADQVIAPSPSIQDTFLRRYPSMRVMVAEHLDAERQARYPPVHCRRRTGRAARVLVLGALGREKGADLLDTVASRARCEGVPLNFHLLGYACRPLKPVVTVHGPYRERELKARIRRLRPDLVWFPCQWPETYSYTLSAVLELGLPVVTPQLGALQSRIRGRPLSVCTEYPQSAEAHLRSLEKFAERLRRQGERVFVWRHQPPRRNFYSRDYPADLFQLARPRPAAMPSVRELELLLSEQPLPAVSGAERLLVALSRLRAHPAVARLAARVPLSLQRAVKRLLSRRPLHEVASHGIRRV